MVLFCFFQASTSLPGSPFTLHRGSQFNWRKQFPTQQSNDRRPLVLPYLENLDLPYADDSTAVTPTSEDLCNFQNAQNYLTVRQRLSSTSYSGRMSQLETRFAANSRKASYASHQSRYSPHVIDLPRFRIQDKKCEPTHFHFATSAKHRAAQRALEPRSKKIEVIFQNIFYLIYLSCFHCLWFYVDYFKC